MNDPYTQAGYYGYIVDIDQFTDAKEISNGIRELANLLAMINMHPSIPAEAKDILKTCEPRMKTVLVRFRLFPPLSPPLRVLTTILTPIFLIKNICSQLFSQFFAA